MPHPTYSPAETVRALRQAQAGPVLAHPGLGGSERFLRELVDAGLVGLEVHHPAHRPGMVEWFRREARRYHLIATGGSDAHGSTGPYAADLGDVPAPPEAADALLAAREGGRQP